ncbi:hypothetical protein [Sphingobium limneticum]|jgi:hypothetical protein|uniref:hypothetical protein n=1 Tax=Sphingobium limneticum TaxID=1007511 RepID=UPI00055A2103|nr:hypothetical protein [Sphingobium limneticum]
MISIVNTECHVPKTFSDLAKIAAWGRLGPVGWEHIAFSGDFLWDRAAASAGRKALNLPPDSRAA